MRTTLAEVVRHRRPEWLPDWWLDTPWKRPRNWWTLLTLPGRGWLRWAAGIYKTYDYIEDVGHAPGPDMVCLPPVRRALLPAKNLASWLLHGGGWVKDDVFGWMHLSPQGFGVQRWSKFSDMRDPEWPDAYLVP